MKKIIGLAALIAISGFTDLFTPAGAQSNDIKAAISSMGLREVGPAFMGGRISHIEVDPTIPTTWYVAAGSGGVWKTTNAGVTFKAIFEDQSTYSIGTIAIDPNDRDTIWVGTGENVSGRHVGWGDGIYKSLNGGKTWKNMGLPNSEHIGRILIDPRDSNTIFVASEGPLWSSGGERGVYKSTDGGTSWENVLTVDKNTGVTDIEFQPGNPDQVYAATYQRRRHVWGLFVGGGGGGIYISHNNGGDWLETTLGLPKSDMGKIGLAVTPANPSLLYETIEANEEDRGFYRSQDGGESFEKKNSYISGGTGPHYYMELEASPTDADVVYQMDVFVRVTRDGGKTFEILESGWSKHSDNHAFWIDPKNSDHLLVGTDAGLYESFDDGKNWRHSSNLPISQFYKVAMDNTEPFYNILGGAQDLGTISGPSRTMTTDGVRNQDWYVPSGADGYGVAFDPNDNNIQYMEFQEGVLFRLNKNTQELIGIQPQSGPDEAPERWNWDTPVVTSSHVTGRIYVGSQRVWRSDDRGNNWTPISGDLTKSINRYTLEYAGRVWSVDDLHDNGAMSKYSTITAISESPLDKALLYSGSDDGLINVTLDGGKNWVKSGKLPGVPNTAFINDVDAGLHNKTTVYAIADAHKTGDYNPYIFRSTNNGGSWRSIKGDLPVGLILWAIQEDHINSNLLFLGAEDGLYVSINGGTNWNKFGGAPTIPFRDVKLQRRDNDIVGATFGRGFYILDDYAPLREIADKGLQNGLLPVRDAWWYIENEPMQARGQATLGSEAYRAENPALGASIRYYISDIPLTQEETRHEKESALRKERKDTPFPGYDTLENEAHEGSPSLMVRINNNSGSTVRWLKTSNKNGLGHVTWDLRWPSADPIDLRVPGFKPPWMGIPQGPLASPGIYNAHLVLVSGDEVREIGESRPFNVKPVMNGPLGTNYVANARFGQEVSEALRQVGVMDGKIVRMENILRHMKVSLVNAPRADTSLFARLDAFGVNLSQLNTKLRGDQIRGRLNENSVPSIYGRLRNVSSGALKTREAPTGTHRMDFKLGKFMLNEAQTTLENLLSEINAIEVELEKAGAPSWR
ncbi:MAG: glycosyl hydrolase [Sphingomonadales bacterium]